jgi:hypothetical protein
MKTVGTATRVVEGISKEEIFEFWADVNNWEKWNDNIDSATLEGAFKAGSFFTLFLKGGQKVKIELLKVEENKSFTDLTKFPLTKMFGIHEIVEKDDKIELIATIKIEGILSFLWRKIVAQGVADSLGSDMDKMIKLIENEKK